jgi:hypothetical protein
MAAWLIAVVGGVYLLTAVSLWLQGKPGLAVAFLGYAFANIGLWMEAR